jgi:hypothetical protein
MTSAILRSRTKAYADWKAAGGFGDVPAVVVAAADAEIEALRKKGYSSQDIIEGKALINYNNGGNGGNAGGPNKMLLIGGAIAAAALLVLVLRK